MPQAANDQPTSAWRTAARVSGPCWALPTSIPRPSAAAAITSRVRTRAAAKGVLASTVEPCRIGRCSLGTDQGLPSPTCWVDPDGRPPLPSYGPTGDHGAAPGPG